MDDFIKALDECLDYISHEVIDDFIYITVKSNRGEPICPFCGMPSTKAHSSYPRGFQDLPVMGKKSIIQMDNRKMFCINPDCKNKTFAERFSFLGDKAYRTNRLEDEILRVSLNCSSIAASALLSETTAIIGKSAICKLLKKNRTCSR